MLREMDVHVGSPQRPNNAMVLWIRSLGCYFSGKKTPVNCC